MLALRSYLHSTLSALPESAVFAHLRHTRAHWLGPAVGAAIALEITFYLIIQRRAYPWREMLTSVGVHIMRAPMKLLLTLIVAPIAYVLWTHRLTTVPLSTTWGLVALFLGTEFAYYWMHRASHEIRWLWASHVVHHSPEHLHLGSSFRVGLTDLFSGTWLFFLPLYVLGLNPLGVGAVLGINGFYQFWLHTDLVGRLGPLEWVLNTPSHHRVHHASNSEYLDRNYGGILIIWDRLFGTFAEERPDEAIRYGLTHPIGSLNPFTIAFHEWTAMARDAARGRGWQERLKILFGRPGASLGNRDLSTAQPQVT